MIAQEKKFEKAIIGTAVVIEAKGLPAVLTSTFLAAYTLLSSHAFPLQSFRTLEMGTTWLRALPDQETYVRADSGIVGEVRRLLESRLAA